MKYGMVVALTETCLLSVICISGALIRVKPGLNRRAFFGPQPNTHVIGAGTVFIEL